MTLRKITFHKNILKSEKIEGQKVVETKIADADKWDPDISKSGFYSPENAKQVSIDMKNNSYEKPSHYDPNKLARIPQETDDNRSLLEAKFSITIELENQGKVKNQLVELYNDAIIMTEGKMNGESCDIGRCKYFCGIKEAIYTAKKDIYEKDNGVNEEKCLYELSSKYDNISNAFSNFIDENIFDNSENTNYSESYHLGLASGYKNVSEMIKDKLARAENERYRIHINPSQ